MKKIEKFLIIEKNVLIVSYIVLIYTLTSVNYVISRIYIEEGIYIKIYGVELFVISIISAIVMALLDYIKRKEIAKGICFQVIEKYGIRDQYERFLAVKKCIESFEKNGKRNIRRNVYVIEASIERDQAYSVVFPLIITITTAIFIEKELISITSPVSMIMITLVALSVVEIVSIIPRNAFIKKVVECIKKEHKIE